MRHFELKEFICSCGCGEVHMDESFLSMLDEARYHAGIPFIVNSGYRCVPWNAAVGSTSENHTRGVAADIRCLAGPTRLKIVKALLDVGFRRIGLHRTFIHADRNDGQQSMWYY